MIEVDTITVGDLVWDKWNRHHVTKHTLTPRQVEQVFHDQRTGLQSYSGRLMVLGRCGKRRITVILSPKGKKFYVVTARDMRKAEGDYYQNFLDTYEQAK